jgi:hypothetical protein
LLARNLAGNCVNFFGLDAMFDLATLRLLVVFPAISLRKRAGNFSRKSKEYFELKQGNEYREAAYRFGAAGGA